MAFAWQFWEGEMQFQRQAFNTHLKNIGQQVSWRKSYACPCFNPNSGASKPNCPQCSGKGRIWDSEVPGVLGIASQKVQREWAQFGSWESGDTVVSIPENSPVYEAGQFDRVVLLNSTEQFSIPLTRGQGDKLYGRVEKVSRVFWLDGSGDIVEGGIPTVSNAGALTWSSGAPPAGAQYTICGSRFNEYYVFGAYPSDRNEHQGMRLPKRVVLRSWDLFGRKGT